MKTATLAEALEIRDRVDAARAAAIEARAATAVACRAAGVPLPGEFDFLKRKPSEVLVWQVYAMQAASGTGPIKVGKSYNPRARLASLEIGSPERLKLLGAVAESPSLNERSEHARLADRRLHGEWFDIAPADLPWLEDAA